MRELNEKDFLSVDGGSLIFWDFDEPVYPLECVVPSNPKPLVHYGFPPDSVGDR